MESYSSVPFCVCFHSLSIMILEFIQVVACISSLLLFTAELCSIVWIYYNVWMDIWVVSSFWLVWIKVLWTYVYNFSVDLWFHFSWTGCVDDKHMFNWLRKRQTDFKSGCTIFHFYQSCLSVQCPTPWPTVLSVVLNLTILMGVLWHLIVLSVCVFLTFCIFSCAYWTLCIFSYKVSA